ncbi:hypothetical protein D9758_007703 [Tetrapyrgos nigripes]|uniref:Uncharacterized protein n=1 Tax=Tetrapyrgos nigripes TaxID=182062 RepID=A0A8H5LIR8_9AGAR|nr:hypothetical protein D9758_007703 [Tetrapyrgos nigripes]
MQNSGRSSFSSCEEGICFGRRAPGLHLELPKIAPLNLRSCSGSSSQLAKVDDRSDLPPKKDFNTYDEFCSMLRDDYELYDEPVQEIEVFDECATPVNPKTFSLIDHWRSGINGTEVGPPKSPFIVADFASSPVAAINFASLQVTSLPPCNSTSFTNPRLRSSHSEAAVTNDSPTANVIVTQPTHFYDLYDAELERMIDETVDETASSDDTDAVSTVYVPPVPSKNLIQRTTKNKISSAIRWLPKRLKYTLLSKVKFTPSSAQRQPQH